MQGPQTAYIVQVVVLLVSGVYYPSRCCRTGCRPSRSSAGDLAIDGLRAPLADGADVAGLWRDIWPALLIGAVSIPLGLRAFLFAERYAKRTGRLKRSDR